MVLQWIVGLALWVAVGWFSVWILRRLWRQRRTSQKPLTLTDQEREVLRRAASREYKKRVRH